MFDWLFGEKNNLQIGIDVGSSAIKIVELTKKNERLYLTNYALAQSNKEADFNINELKEEESAKIIKAMIEEAGFKSRRASISLPVDKTFSTVIEMPIMTDAEMAAAIPFEAQKYIPVPMEDIVLDWVVIPSDKSAGKVKPVDGTAAESKADGIQVLLVAVPKNIINKLTRIAKLAGLEVAALEQEAFSLVRSLVGSDKNNFLLVDLGHKSTDFIIVDQGFIRFSHNLESTNKEIILMEIDRVVNTYQIRYNKKVEQCFLAGGRAAEKELIDFLKNKLPLTFKPGDAFARIGHDSSLAVVLKELGPQLAIAAGLAMRGII
jgi:type IV pilus assembly protein PilM